MRQFNDGKLTRLHLVTLFWSAFSAIPGRERLLAQNAQDTDAHCSDVLVRQQWGLQSIYMVVKKYIEISRTPLWSDGDDGVV